MCSSESKNDEEISESDCCGNGCAHCVLDSKPLSSQTTRVDLQNKSNVLLSYRKYTLIQSIQLLQYIVQLKFTLADKEQLTDSILDCPPGHHIMMRAPDPNAAESADNKYLLRPYSPFWTDAIEFEFEILVNLKPNGQMTKYIESLQLGDEVVFRGPVGVFMYQPSMEPDRVLVIFSQGVAIAPTIPIVRSILENEDDMTRIYHYSCFQNLENAIFRDKLNEFKRFWNFSSRIYLSREQCGECGAVGCEHFRRQLKYKEQVYAHRLGAEDICRDVDGFGSGRKEIVICGSKSFQNFVEESLVGCNVNKENIFVL